MRQHKKNIGEVNDKEAQQVDPPAPQFTPEKMQLRDVRREDRAADREAKKSLRDSQRKSRCCRYIVNILPTYYWRFPEPAPRPRSASPNNDDDSLARPLPVPKSDRRSRKGSSLAAPTNAEERWELPTRKNTSKKGKKVQYFVNVLPSY